MIQVCEPLIGQKEIDNVVDCLKSGRISGYGGKYLEQFEHGFADYCGVQYGVAVSNCGIATLVTLEALGIGKGDEVIAPTFTMAAPHFAIVRAGARPVLVDAEYKTWNMNTSLIESKITKQTKAILVAHVYGHPADMSAIMDIAKRRKLLVIEDAAEVHGAEYKGKKCGSFGIASNFSFYFNKTITTGEGGMVLTNDGELAKRIKLLRGYATDEYNRFVHKYLGFNFRMSNVQAAIGCAQLEKLDKFVEKKRHIAAHYTEGLRDIPGLCLPIEMKWAKSSYWVYGLLIKPPYPLTRDELMKVMLGKGIETRQFFVGMHLQPVFRRLGIVNGGHLYPVSDDLTANGLYLPNGVNLTDKQISFICEVIHENSIC